jgi:hypothetical protein
VEVAVVAVVAVVAAAAAACGVAVAVADAEGAGAAHDEAALGRESAVSGHAMDAISPKRSALPGLATCVRG